jgi:hypothetical protein|tara:strand:- start:28 stop:270 length:243 start_codon:yes stop_codon:yes gene_type:complete
MKFISKIRAATKIFNERKTALSAKEIIDIALKRKLIKVNGKTPHATMNADFINENHRREKRNRKTRFRRTSEGKWRYIGN